MAIYKVHIKREDNKTIYTINATTLATVKYHADLDKWNISAPNIEAQANTQEEADKAARESVAAFLATLGIVPEFIND